MCVLMCGARLAEQFAAEAAAARRPGISEDDHWAILLGQIHLSLSFNSHWARKCSNCIPVLCSSAGQHCELVKWPTAQAFILPAKLERYKLSFAIIFRFPFVSCSVLSQSQVVDVAKWGHSLIPDYN